MAVYEFKLKRRPGLFSINNVINARKHKTEVFSGISKCECKYLNRIKAVLLKIMYTYKCGPGYLNLCFHSFLGTAHQKSKRQGFISVWELIEGLAIVTNYSKKHIQGQKWLSCFIFFWENSLRKKSTLVVTSEAWVFGCWSMLIFPVSGNVRMPFKSFDGFHLCPPTNAKIKNSVFAPILAPVTEYLGHY